MLGDVLDRLQVLPRDRNILLLLLQEEEGIHNADLHDRGHVGEHGGGGAVLTILTVDEDGLGVGGGEVDARDGIGDGVEDERQTLREFALVLEGGVPVGDGAAGNVLADRLLGGEVEGVGDVGGEVGWPG